MIKVIEMPHIGSKKAYTRSFAFDKDSTENFGHFRLINPDRFDPKAMDGKFITRYKKHGISVRGVTYIVGHIKGVEYVQSIRFARPEWTEGKARAWWKRHASKFEDDVKMGRLRKMSGHIGKK